MRKEYTRKEVAAKAGISDRTVWFYTEKGLVVPEIDHSHGRGTTRKYSARNILEILVIRELGKHGLNLETIKQIMTAGRIGPAGFDPWDPESPVESDLKYYLLMFDPNTDHGRLIVTLGEPDGSLKINMKGSDGLPLSLPQRDYSCLVVVDLTNLRKKLF
jgi:DNA-binding transcriptional MerR regulator